VTQSSPIFAPNQKSTYSNVAFDILGLVVENVTGIPYTDYVSSFILTPFGMNQSSFDKPNDSVSVLPKDVSWYFDVDEGIQNPTGGLYSSSNDLSRFLRYILTHYNGITPALNWLHPASYSNGIKSQFGMPWEIFHTSDILNYTSRPVSFVTKSGGLPGYTSIIMMVPEYDLGITILVGGKGNLLDQIRETLVPPLIRAIDATAHKQMEERYAGTYGFPHEASLNSSLTLSASTSSGLHVTRWISNGTNMLDVPHQLFQDLDKPMSDAWRAQLIPTLLYKDEKKQSGEIWRLLLVPGKPKSRGVFDDFCISDVDNLKYDGKPLNEFVFRGSASHQYSEVDLTGFDVRLQRQSSEMGGMSRGYGVEQQPLTSLHR